MVPYHIYPFTNTSRRHITLFLINSRQVILLLAAIINDMRENNKNFQKYLSFNWDPDPDLHFRKFI